MIKKIKCFESRDDMRRIYADRLIRYSGAPHLKNYLYDTVLQIFRCSAPYIMDCSQSTAY